MVEVMNRAENWSIGHPILDIIYFSSYFDKVSFYQMSSSLNNDANFWPTRKKFIFLVHRAMTLTFALKFGCTCVGHCVVWLLRGFIVYSGRLRIFVLVELNFYSILLTVSTLIIPQEKIHIKQYSK